MKKSLLTTIAFLLTAFISTTAQAQVLIIIEESPAYRPAAPAPRPCPPPAPVVRRMAPVAAPQQAMYPTVPNEFNYSNNFMPMRRWTLGFISQSSAADEAYSGGGMFLQYMFSRKFGIEGSIVGMSANSYDSEYYTKESTRAGLSALYFMGDGLKNTGVSWYLKGGLMWNSVYSMEYDSYYDESSEATHLEGGIGFQWRLFSGWLSFGSEVTLSVPIEEENTDDYYTSAYTPSLNFRLFAAIHF